MEFDLSIPKAEAAQEPHTLIVGGKRFTMPPEAPINMIELVQDMRPGAALRMLLGDQYDDADAAAGGFSIHDLARIVNHCYGFTMGESPASDASSDSDGDSSRQTSSGTTASTLPKRSGRPSAGGGAASDGS